MTLLLPVVHAVHGDDEMGVLAQYYHLPWVSTRSLAWDYLQETAIGAPFVLCFLGIRGGATRGSRKRR